MSSSLLEIKVSCDDDEVNMCTQGVSVSYLTNFAKTLNSAMTTREVCEKLVLPRTEDRKCAYHELGLDQKKDVDGNPVLGEANYFCSHAWKYEFKNVVNALEMFCKNKDCDPGKTYIWFDLFMNNQHKAPNLSYRWWSTTFREAIQSFGKIILVLQPWTDPIPMTRAWCLWEIFCTIDTKSEFHVAMCEAEHESFKKSLVSNFERIQLTISGIDARRAAAWKKSDREKIFEAIENSIGFSTLNEKVIGKMRDWLLRAGEKHYNETKALKGEACMETLNICNCLGKLYRDVSDYKKAEELNRISVRGYAKLVGENSPHTCQAMNDLAFCLQKQEKLDEAIKTHRRCLESRMIHFKENHKDTTQTMSNLATALRMKGDLDEARKLFKKAVECRDRTKNLGPNHPATLYTVSQYALTLSECGDFELAHEFHKRAIEGLQKFFSPKMVDSRKHQLTLLAINNMGYHKMLKRDYGDALHLLLEAWRGRLENGGEEAVPTKESKALLMKLKKMGKTPRGMDFSPKTVDQFLKGKERRRELWMKAKNYLALKRKFHGASTRTAMLELEFSPNDLDMMRECSVIVMNSVMNSVLV